MNKYNVKLHLEREVEAEDKDNAIEKFFTEIEEEDGLIMTNQPVEKVIATLVKQDETEIIQKFNDYIEKLLNEKYKDYSEASRTLYWGCKECGAPEANEDIKNFLINNHTLIT